MRTKNFDIILILTIVALNMLYVLMPIHIAALGTALALPLVFLLPGYVVTEVFFYKRSLNTTYRVILSIGLSLTIDILGGFVLNMFAIGLRAISWVVLLGLLIVILSLLLAFLRRGSFINNQHRPIFHIHIYEYALIGIATLIVALSLQYSAISLAQQSHPNFTQLWLLPPQTAKNCTLRLGVRSFESTPTTYRILIKQNGKQVGAQFSIVLVPQEEWDGAVPLSATETGDETVAVSLYKADRPDDVYREVHMAIHTVRQSAGKEMQCNASVSLAYANQSIAGKREPRATQ